MLVPTSDSNSWKNCYDGVVGVPTGQHLGAFGRVRKYHVHEGIDLYCPEGSTVRAVEDGLVVAVEKFTGPSANPPSPWWMDTEAILIEGMSGTVLYGEVTSIREVGDLVKAGDLLGFVIQVLTVDKGRPMSMLHLELHESGTTESVEWSVGDPQPCSLKDPTPYLLSLCD